MKIKILFFYFLSVLSAICYSQTNKPSKESEFDRQVEEFLVKNKYSWRNMNIPYSDGELLYRIIVENGYKNIVEIGTSTGHSTIWLAWAASKTGGKVITIEINEWRQKQAIENFKEAGVLDFIDSRLADAHELVKELDGPIDFVFSDADRDWYKNYFVDLYPKLSIDGCYTAHNVIRPSRDVRDFLNYIESMPDMETTINKDSQAGISVSYKRK